jgi:hypothetical protein
MSVAIEVMVRGGGGLITRTNVAVPVPPAFVALKATFEVPGVVGVPEIKPLVALTDNPVGNAVALKLVGLLVPVIW